MKIRRYLGELIQFLGLLLKLNQVLVRSDFHETLQEGSAGEYLQIHGRDFRYFRYGKYLNLQGKLELLTLMKPWEPSLGN